jgi:DNA-directed RNA polymerase specialized sigma24 family protein
LSAEATLLQRWVEQYGDLVFDFCAQVLGDPGRGQLAFRAILKDRLKGRFTGRLRRRAVSLHFVEYERAWILQGVCAHLRGRNLAAELAPTTVREDHLEADQSPEARLSQLGAYLKRLDLEDRLLVLLRDKYGLPYNEIAMALELPEDSLKLRRGQALRTLQDWVWEYK